MLAETGLIGPSASKQEKTAGAMGEESQTGTVREKGGGGEERGRGSS